MAAAIRWLFRIFVTLALLAGLASAALYWFMARSLPDYDARLEVAGLDAPLEIVRDNSNVPHIFGETDADVFFGLGFAHAQDRLWQMTLMRRTAQGRLSEIFGARTAATDELMRRLDIYNLARQSLGAQSDETMTALEAYAAGVNAWVSEVNTGARGRGAPEFWMFEPQIAPWSPADSLAMIKLLALNLGTHLGEEVLRARVSLALDDPERLRDILPDAPGQGVAALPDYAALVPGAGQGATRLAAATPDLWPVAERGLGGASNVWAAGPTRSASGGTLLANDPHLAFTAPTLWYLARLELSSGGVIGATVPGMPLVLLGRSERLGWGITASYADDQDLHIEKVNPDNRNELLTPEGFKPMRSRPSILKIRDADPVTLTLRWSENGPILPRRQFDLSEITPPGHVVSLSWTALSPEDGSMTAGLELMRAGDVDAALAAAEGFVAPGLNLAVIDAERIAMKTIGALPRRRDGHASKGRLPTPGWIAENRWDGILPYDANPVFADPAGGIVGNTNNKVVDRPFPLHVSYHWGDTQRIQRWRRLMQNREVHTRESFMEAQLDTVSPTARSLLPLVGADLWFTGEAAPEGTPERLRQRALALLAGWNGEMNEHLPEPLIYAAWMRALQTRLIADDLGPLAAEFTHLEPLFVERVFRNIDGAAGWCDVVQSARVETCTDMARLALDDALIWIDERYGTALESLRWGDAHEALHAHETLGGIGGIGWFANIRQSTSGGDNTLSRGLSRGTGTNPFTSVHGAGYRGIYDFADPDSSVFITSTGQSGHPLSRHYDDLGDLWRRGEYIPMTLDPDLARAAAVGVTELIPAGRAE
ncbi:penicillin acylase family protein [Palleronia sediminis]|uniref:Penicillin acylase family protein n=1 Tax=Palleronia sediminis TaxID=2547833 RepID=A0A4R6AM87_9RHOB|nr:penicillin acylase family protein [Palleronia sediminis]TDL83648.1 penicillin acylase family protein [Palleronia sediminis]